MFTAKMSQLIERVTKIRSEVPGFPMKSITLFNHAEDRLVAAVCVASVFIHARLLAFNALFNKARLSSTEIIDSNWLLKEI